VNAVLRYPRHVRSPPKVTVKADFRHRLQRANAVEKVFGRCSEQQYPAGQTCPILGYCVGPLALNVSVGRSAPIGNPFQLCNVGRRDRSTAARSPPDISTKQIIMAAMITSAARPAPSSHFTASPRP